MLELTEEFPKFFSYFVSAVLRTLWQTRGCVGGTRPLTVGRSPMRPHCDNADTVHRIPSLRAITAALNRYCCMKESKPALHNRHSLHDALQTDCDNFHVNHIWNQIYREAGESLCCFMGSPCDFMLNVSEFCFVTRQPYGHIGIVYRWRSCRVCRIVKAGSVAYC